MTHAHRNPCALSASPPAAPASRSLRAMVRTAALALGIAVAVPAAPAAAGEPMLVELFTSQGCSSCPPADAVLSEIADRKDIVALSFHVDYWDYLGWRDTFARAAFSRRQFAYRDAWGERVVYTPQMVVGGHTPIVGSRRDEVTAALKAGTADAGTIEIEGDGDAVMATLNGVPDDAVIWTATFIQAATVEIERGENRGRTITYRNVVRELMRLGTAGQVGASFAVPQPAPGEGIAVWVQEDDLGTVHAAARFEVPLSTAAIR